jgi:hypothetical protein
VSDLVDLVLKFEDLFVHYFCAIGSNLDLFQLGFILKQYVLHFPPSSIAFAQTLEFPTKAFHAVLCRHNVIVYLAGILGRNFCRSKNIRVIGSPKCQDSAARGLPYTWGIQKLPDSNDGETSPA